MSPVRLVALAGAVAGLAAPAAGQTEGFSGPRTQRVPIFFPANPPPLGWPVVRSQAAAPGRLNAPTELSLFVDDWFYPPLGTRLAVDNFPAKLRERVEAYRTEKIALRQQLQSELARQRNAEPPARLQALQALARTQAPRLVALEKSAEELRRDLIYADGHWGAYREWRLGEAGRRSDSPQEIATVLRAYAYYEVALLPAQRGLLREISMELAMAAETAERAAAAQPYVFFSPELSRIVFPGDVSDEINAKFTDYQMRKAALKKELYDAVSERERHSVSILRPNPMRRLADRQAAQLAAVEALAEEIRRGLADHRAAPGPIETSVLPLRIANRLSAVIRRRADLQQEIDGKIQTLLAPTAGLPIRVNYAFETDGLKFIVIPTRGARGASAETVAQIDAVRTELSVLADEFGRHLADLFNERDAIRNEAAGILGRDNISAVDAALSHATRLAMQQDSDELYRDYRAAVFEPGLSPAQRRLLFGGAIEQLDLPLPRAESQPTRRAAGW